VSLETSLQALLAAVAPAYQDVAKQSQGAPFIVWTEVISSINNTLLGASNVQNTRLQIDCYSATPAARQVLATSVSTAMANASFSNVLLSTQSLYETETKLFRCTLDFSVWST